ncbi:MAG: branched-chain amino acid ABC transporter permease [Nitrososphaerota archaeon]|nr:branched-chain amino acid ABC transporter permease [Nitrososphaerota archaeon]
MTLRAGPRLGRMMGAGAMKVVVAGSLAAALVPLAAGSDQGILGAFAIYFVWITLAVSWNVAGGFAGLLNLGIVAFFGLGVAVAGAGLQSGFPLPEVVALSALAGALLAAVLVPVFRLKSFYFAMGTFVIPYMVKPLVELVGGSAVSVVPGGDILSSSQIYYAGLALAVFSVSGVFLLMNTKSGLALRAIGADETASSGAGVDVVKYKAIALAASGALASLAGMYYLEIAGTVDTTIFQNLNFSLLPLFMVIIGGVGTIEGPVIGALIYSALSYFIISQFPGSTADVFVLSLAVIAMAIFRPRGLASRVVRR